MEKIGKEVFTEEALEVLRLGIHGGFIKKGGLGRDVSNFCKKSEWVEEAVKFKCPTCDEWYTSTEGFLCPISMREVTPDEKISGYKITSKASNKFEVENSSEKKLIVTESLSLIDFFSKNKVIFSFDVEEEKKIKGIEVHPLDNLTSEKIKNKYQ